MIGRKEALENLRQAIAASHADQRKLRGGSQPSHVPFLSAVSHHDPSIEDEEENTRRSLIAVSSHKERIRRRILEVPKDPGFTKEAPVVLDITMGLGDLQDFHDTKAIKNALEAVRRVVEYSEEDRGARLEELEPLLELVPVRVYCEKIRLENSPGLRIKSTIVYPELVVGQARDVITHTVVIEQDTQNVYALVEGLEAIKLTLPLAGGIYTSYEPAWRSLTVTPAASTARLLNPHIDYGQVESSTRYIPPEVSLRSREIEQIVKQEAGSDRVAVLREITPGGALAEGKQVPPLVIWG